jgi:hypothetical protein
MGHPRLKAAIALGKSTDSDLGLLFGGMRNGIRFEAGGTVDFARLISNLSGFRSVHDAARLADVSSADAQEIVERLSSAGLAYSFPDADEQTPLALETALSAGKGFLSAIRFDYGRHPLFAMLPQSERIFLGCAYEYFFLVKDARIHVSMAIEKAEPGMQPVFRRYLEEEKDHADGMAPALADALGIPVSLLAECVPCAAADAAILKTRELARADTLAYAAATAFCEAPAGRPFADSEIPGAWRSESKELLASLTRHFDADRAAGHASLFEAALRSRDSRLARKDVAAALEAAHQYKHYLDNLNHEILRTYGAEGSVLPRFRASFGDFETEP